MLIISLMPTNGRSVESNLVRYFRKLSTYFCNALRRGRNREWIMSLKKFIAILTDHNCEMKKAFWSGSHKLTKTDIEWRDGYIFDKCQFTANCTQMFFLQWKTENALGVLEFQRKRIEKRVATQLYEIDTHINVHQLTGKILYKSTN